jgi:hypothetical protein
MSRGVYDPATHSTLDLEGPHAPKDRAQFTAPSAKDLEARFVGRGSDTHHCYSPDGLAIYFGPLVDCREQVNQRGYVWERPQPKEA